MSRLHAIAAWLNDPLHLVIGLLCLMPMLLVVLYVASYRQAVPFIDEWNLNGRIAIATADGKITPDTLLFVAGGHRTIFTNLATILTTALTNWDLRVQAWLPLAAAVGILALLALLFQRSQPGATIYALVPFALLTFAVYRTYVWWSARFSHWTLVNAMMLLSLWVANRRLTGRMFVLLLVLGWATTYTSAGGMIVWPLLLLVLLLSGNRDWRMIALWVVSGMIAVTLYLSNSGTLTGLPTGSIDAGDEVLTLSIPPVGQMVEFVLKVTGSGLLADPALSTAAEVVGVCGIVLVIVYAVGLWRRDRDLKPLLPWLALAVFALGSAAQIGLGRLSNIGLDRAITSQYGVPASMFWIALTALMVMAVVRSRPSGMRWPIGVTFVLAAVGLCLYGYSVASALQSEALFWDRPLRVIERTHETDDEQCVLDYVLTRRASCLKRIMVTDDKDKYFLDELATRRIGIFATQMPKSLLPPSYQPGSPILLITQTAWLNVHIRDLLLSGVPEESLVHIVVDGEKVKQAADIPNPLRAIITDTSPASLDTLGNALGRAEHVWLLETHDGNVQTLSAAAIEALVRLGYGYVSADRRDFDKPDTPLELTLLGFARH